MGVQNYSPRTITGRRTYLKYFVAWSLERGLMHPAEITKPILERYQRHLFHHRKRDGEPMGVRQLTNLFEPFTPNRLTQLVRDYINAAELGKTGSCHLLRHTCATIMLENGADIRFIQQLLGHAELTTTQIYTQVSIQKLKQVHQACHPSSSFEKPGDRKAPKPPKPEPPPP